VLEHGYSPFGRQEEDRERERKIKSRGERRREEETERRGEERRRKW
jgi:hypothetical protein